MNWYVFRPVSNMGIATCRDIKARYGVECFVTGKRKHYQECFGRIVRVNRFAIHSYVFVRADKSTFSQITRDIVKIVPVLRVCEDVAEPLTVPDKVMTDFIRVAEFLGKEVDYFDPNKLDFKRSYRVRVTGGPLEGIEGIFLQIGGRHEKRVVIPVENLIAVATGSISYTLVERI